MYHLCASRLILTDLFLLYYQNETNYVKKTRILKAMFCVNGGTQRCTQCTESYCHIGDTRGGANKPNDPEDSSVRRSRNMAKVKVHVVYCGG